MILLWGGGKRHPGFLQAFPIKVGGGPPHSSLKTSVLKVLLSNPPSSGLSPRIGKGTAEPTSLAVKAGGPEHARATAMALRGPERGRAGQGLGENDLDEEEWKKEVRDALHPRAAQRREGDEGGGGRWPGCGPPPLPPPGPRAGGGG